MSIKPGRELDALIAVKVMGLKSADFYIDYDALCIQDKNIIDRGQGWWPELLKYYSTDIAAAWEVVEKALRRGDSPVVGCDLDNNTGEPFYEARINDALAYGESAPHAICLAALKAVEK